MNHGESLKKALSWQYLRDPDDGPFKVALACVTALALSLIWGFHYPAFTDSANVAYTGEVLHDLWSGAGSFTRWHAVRADAWSHALFFRSYHLLRYILPPIATLKVLTTIAVLALPATMFWLTRTMRLSRWLCLPAFALAFNTNLSMGYLPFVLGLPVVPLCLGIIEQNRVEPRRWHLPILGLVVALSPLVHFFLSAVLVPIVLVWLSLGSTGHVRRVAWGGLLICVGMGLYVRLPHTGLPPFEKIVQWVPYTERWKQFDRDVLNWTTDGCPALSFPLLLVAFVASLMLTRGHQPKERWPLAARVPLTLLMLFALYMLGPTYISWPEPAWGFGTRVGIAWAILLPLTAATTATGWRRFAHVCPWVVFTFWHLSSLISPLRAFDEVTRPLSALVPMIPKHSTVLPMLGSEWLKNPSQYSFGGFTGFVLRHTPKWAAVETQSYQPYSFCNMGYHPIVCKEVIPAPKDIESAQYFSARQAQRFDYVLIFENSPSVPTHIASVPMELIRRAGGWSLWRPQH